MPGAVGHGGPCQSHFPHGSAGQPAGSEFDSGTDADTSSDEGVGNLAGAVDILGKPEAQTPMEIFMKKRDRRARRAVRRVSRAKDKGRGKGKRRRSHGRNMLTFLASPTGPQHEEISPGEGRGRGRASGKVMGVGVTRRMPAGKPWNVTSAIAPAFSARVPPGRRRGRGPSTHSTQTDSDMQH
eukprot:7421456-Pyramimonas_sp.AAC.1